MAEQNEQNDFTITVNDKDFKFNDLSDENKALVAHIRDLEGQLNQVGFRHEQLSASKNFFSDKLVASLSESKEEASAEASE
jgi:septum formation inhibitor MinC